MTGLRLACDDAPACGAGLRVVRVAAAPDGCGLVGLGVVVSEGEGSACAVREAALGGGGCAVSLGREGDGPSLPLLGPFVDRELAEVLGEPASAAPRGEWRAVPLGGLSSAMGAGRPGVRLARAGGAGAGAADDARDGGGGHAGLALEWTLRSAAFSEMVTSAGVMVGTAAEDSVRDGDGDGRGREGAPRAPPLPRNHSVMVTVDARTGPDTWTQLDSAMGSAAQALGGHEAQMAADPAAHGLGGGRGDGVDAEHGVAARLRAAVRAQSMREGDFEAAARAEAAPASELLAAIGKEAADALRAEAATDGDGSGGGMARQLCAAEGASGSDCRAARLYRGVMEKLEAPMVRGVTGVTRGLMGWASSDNIGAAVARMLGRQRRAGSGAQHGPADALPDTWLAGRLNRSLAPPADPRTRHVLRRAAGTASAMMAAAAHEHAARRALAAVRSGRLHAGSMLAPSGNASGAEGGGPDHAAGPTPALAAALEAMGLHPRHGGIRSHEAVEAALLEVAGTARRGGRRGSGGARPGEDATDAAARQEAHDVIQSAAAVAGGIGGDGTRSARTGRHAAALAGMLLETDAAVRGLLSAGVTAREAFACIVDSIMNVAPEILVQIIVNVVKQPFADLMSIIMSLITPPMLAPIPFPKLTFPGPDAGSKPEPRPVKCECVKPKPPGPGAGGMPDLASMLPFPMLLQGDAMDLARREALLQTAGATGTDTSSWAALDSAWGDVRAATEAGRGGPGGGPGASGTSRLASLDPTATEGGGGVVDAPGAGPGAAAGLPSYVWDLSSVPAGGTDGGLHVAPAAQAVSDANDAMARKGAGQGGAGAPAARYTQRFGRAGAAAEAGAAARAAAMARLDRETDAAVERATSLGFSSDAAVDDIMRLAEAHGRVSGQADLSRLRARASLAATAGTQGHAEADVVARLGLRTFAGVTSMDEVMGEHRCGCPVGALRVVPAPASGGVGVTGGGSGAAGGAPASGELRPSAAEHEAPYRESGAWYPSLHETRPGGPRGAMERAEADLQQRLADAHMRVAALAPEDAASEAPSLPEAAQRKLNAAVGSASKLGDELVRASTAARGALSSRDAPVREAPAATRREEDRSIRVSGHKAPPGAAKLVADAMPHFRAGDAAPAGDEEDGAVHWQSQEEFGGEVPAPADGDGLLQTNERLRLGGAARRAGRRGPAVDGSGVDTDADTDTDADEVSLLQAAARAKAPGGDKGAPISRIVALAHRVLVSRLMSSVLPAARDRAVSAILTTLPDLAARSVVLEIAPRMIPRLTTALTASLVRELVPRVLFRLTQRLTQKLTKQLTPRLATSVALASVRSLTRDPSADHECFLCFHGWDDAFKKRSAEGRTQLKAWLRSRAQGEETKGLPPYVQVLPEYCTPCLQSIQHGVALDEVVTARVRVAAEFYGDFYGSRRQSMELTARAVRETVAEAREGFAAPDRAWDLKPEDMDLPE